MKTLTFLLRNSRALVIVAVIAGVLSGASNTGLLAIISAKLSGGLRAGALVPLFILLCAVAPLTRIASELLLVQIGQKAIFDLRMKMCRRILAVPLSRLEELGAHRLTAALTDDVFAITNALVFIPLMCVNIAVVIGCLVYLGWLSWTVFLMVIGIIALGVISYQLPVAAAMNSLRRAREVEDTLFGNFRALIEGVKELKLHRRRRQSFVSDVLEASAQSYRRHNFKGMAVYAVASSWGQLLVFAVIGLVVFVVPNLEQVTTLTLMGYTLAILYMMTPLQVIMSTIPNIARANVALHKLEDLGLSLSAAGEPSDGPTVEGEATDQPPCERLELAGTAHSYRHEGEERAFSLGPLDLSFRRGEIVFLVGGNGSGKTTLAKLLVGLYRPEAGAIRLNGQTITDENREVYRQHFSVVFADFYLFERLLGLDGPELEAHAREYLRRLQLEEKVQVSDGTLSTTKLSHGQRKRLALLTAYLENRPIYLFDEWAADQDPQFKEIFYLHLLPELKAKGKTVFVISHDDHYYFVADRIIKLDYGQVEYDRRTGDEPAPVSVAVPAGPTEPAAGYRS
jgi:putative ATP-binding cassette transporter